jgi:hypothetical protein
MGRVGNAMFGRFTSEKIVSSSQQFVGDPGGSEFSD